MIRRGLAFAGLLTVCSAAASAAIDVEALRGPWPRQIVRELEVGRYPVRWRQHVSRREGLFAAVQFDAPLDREAVWARATQYEDVGRITPGVSAVRYLENTPTRQVIELDVQVLWKTFTLTFEVERDPPREMRFRWAHPAFGQLRGLCVFENAPGTSRTPVELVTHFAPARPVPLGLLLLVERMALLAATERFLEACEQPLR